MSPKAGVYRRAAWGKWRRSRRVIGQLSRGIGLLALLLGLSHPGVALGQGPEAFTALLACTPNLLAWSVELEPAINALLTAEQSGDMLDIAEAAIGQVYPVLRQACPGEAADRLREIGIIALMHGGSAKRMESEAQSFLNDLKQRGLGTSPRAGRLLFVMAREAELSGRIPDSFGFINRALPILRNGPPDDPYRHEAELHLRCLRDAVAMGASSCGAGEDIAGPYGLFPRQGVCDRFDPVVAGLNQFIARLGQPLEVAIFAFCDAERRMRQEIAAASKAPPAEATDRVLNAMEDIARAADRVVRHNAVARAQFRDLAAAYAFRVALERRDAGDSALADHLLSRAHAIADASAPIRREAAALLPAGYKGWLAIEPWGAHLVALMLETRISREVRAHEAFAVMSAAKIDGTSERLRAMVAGGGNAIGNIAGLDAATAALRPGEALLAVRLTPGGIGAGLLVRPDGATLYPIMLTQAAAARLVTAYRTLLTKMDATDFDPTEAVQLYRALFGPLDDMHALNGVTELFLVPDRTIESIPAAALVTNVSGEAPVAPPARMEPVAPRELDTVKFLRDRFAVTMLPSVEDLAALRLAPPLTIARRYAGVADPVGPAIGTPASGRDWPMQPLNLTSGQVRDSWHRFGGEPNSLLIGPDATLENLLGVLADGPFDVVEFATHAVSERPRDAPEAVPEAPWLLISPPPGTDGGDLTQSFLDLSGIDALPLHANLVILSACRTAAPAGSTGEGLLSGLSRAFIQAGAHSLIVTYWDADDSATADITARITTALAADPTVSLGRAVADAARGYESSQTGFRRLPYFWAALGAVGPRSAR